MGSYANLHLGKLLLTTSKSDVDPSVLMLFSENDRIVKKVLQEESKSEDLEGYPLIELSYSASLGIIKDRLDVMGYSVSAIKEIFETDLLEYVSSLKKRLLDPFWSENEILRVSVDKELAILEELSFDAWMNAFNYIIVNNLQPSADLWHEMPDGASSNADLPEIVRYVLGAYFGNTLWFPSYDYRVLLRAAAEVCDLGTIVEYDLSELVLSEYISLEENLCAWARRMTADDYILNSKIVVLTEGSTDAYVISKSLEILYPHLSDFYSFMDFASTRAQGGASTLVSTLKSFCAAGIANRIIALFDNDTAAHSALRGIRTIQFPSNIRVFQYPRLEIAAVYPTLGPQGTVNLDVNGLAGSIEIYLGMDVLTNPDGSLMPIQWRGFDESTNQYQGELSRKSELIDRFEKKLKLAKEQPEVIKSQDWSGMRLILDQLRTAFLAPTSVPASSGA